jgi:hypothetical protein
MKIKITLLLVLVFVVLFSLCYAVTKNTKVPYISLTISTEDSIVANYIRNTDGKVQNNISSKKLSLDDSATLNIDVGVSEGNFSSVDIVWNGNVSKTYAVERVSVIKPITKYDVNTLTITVHTTDKDNNRSDFSRTIKVYPLRKGYGSIMERIAQKNKAFNNTSGKVYLGVIKDYLKEGLGKVLIEETWYNLAENERIVLSDAVKNQSIFYQIDDEDRIVILKFVEIISSGDTN